jgi:hypothetical protein
MISAIHTTKAPSPWAAGSPGAKHHRHVVSLSSPIASVELALDRIRADEIEREVAHLVRRVRGTDAALRVIRAFREPAGPQLNLPMRGA